MRVRLWLWGVFLLVHAVLGWICLGMPGTGTGELAIGLPLGDVTLVYRPWVEALTSGGAVPAVTEPWVYPILALVPMLAALMFGAANYAIGWLTLVALLNAVAFLVLIGRGDSRTRVTAAWWWLAFLVALGPIAVARIDAITVPIAIVALLVLARRPIVATALLTIATWMKVWPAAIIAAAFLTMRKRWHVVATGAATSVVIVAVALLIGSGMNVISFVTEQTGRGLQIEAPVSTPYLWQAALRMPSTFVYYDQDILTFQVTGNGVGTAADLMTPVLALAIAAVLLTGALAVHRGASFVSVFPALSLALIVALIAFNKVGSPQFLCWLIAPIVLGIVYGGHRFAAPATIAIGLAVLTQLIYPYLYGWLLSVAPAMLVVITVRNVGYFVLLGWALAAVWRSGTDAHRRRETLRAAETLENHPPIGYTKESTRFTKE